MTTPDPIKTARLVTREIRNGSRDGRPTKIAVARRTYRAERAEVWDALTSAERLPRWFLPVSGELAVGGRYQFEGNAGGLVERCTEPESLAVTWEFGGQLSWLEVRLSEAEGATTLELVHEAHVDPALWEQFGPGAVGLGWDGALMGLGIHLDTGEDLDGKEHEAWASGPEGHAFFTEAAESWARAAVDAGDEPEQARTAAQGAVAFYTTPPEAAQEG
jgi:uncharacterized protein YndB with AHSA1/START domain